MLVPSSIIDQARDIHPSFTENLHPNNVVRRFLSRWQREIVGRLLIADRHAVRLVETVAFPLPTFEAGHALASEPQYLHGGDVKYGNPDDTRELNIVGWERRYDRVPWPAAAVFADTVYFLGIVRDWANVTSVDLFYAPVPSALPDISTASVLPDQAESAAVAAAAQFMGSRIPAPKGLEAVPLAKLVGDMERAEDKFLTLRSNRARATVGRVKENY